MAIADPGPLYHGVPVPLLAAVMGLVGVIIGALINSRPKVDDYRKQKLVDRKLDVVQSGIRLIMEAHAHCDTAIASIDTENWAGLAEFQGALTKVGREIETLEVEFNTLASPKNVKAI